MQELVNLLILHLRYSNLRSHQFSPTRYFKCSKQSEPVSATIKKNKLQVFSQ